MPLTGSSPKIHVAAPGGSAFDGARVHLSVPQVLPNSLWQTCRLDTVDVDTASYFDAANHRIVIPAAKAGYFLVSGCTTWDGPMIAIVVEMDISIAANAVLSDSYGYRYFPALGYYIDQEKSFAGNLDAGAQIYLKVRDPSGNGNYSVGNSINPRTDTWLAVQRIGPQV